MKSPLVILLILLIPGLCARAATEQEKAFVENPIKRLMIFGHPAHRSVPCESLAKD